MGKIYNILFCLLLSLPVYAGKKSAVFGVYELLCEQRVRYSPASFQLEDFFRGKRFHAVCLSGAGGGFRGTSFPG